VPPWTKTPVISAGLGPGKSLGFVALGSGSGLWFRVGSPALETHCYDTTRTEQKFPLSNGQGGNFAEFA